MRVQLRVHPGAGRQRLHWDGSTLHLWITAPAVDGAANGATVAAVARWAGRPPSTVRLVAGARSRLKLVDIEDFEPPSPRET
ncbi:MAG TPA: DUF167 domain-containing protein [Candidatus Dormibacteraeota bacterium]